MSQRTTIAAEVFLDARAASDLARCPPVDRAAIRSERRATDDRARRTRRGEVDAPTRVAKRDARRRSPRGRGSRGARGGEAPARSLQKSFVGSKRARGSGARSRARETSTIARGSRGGSDDRGGRVRATYLDARLGSGRCEARTRAGDALLQDPSTRPFFEPGGGVLAAERGAEWQTVTKEIFSESSHVIQSVEKGNSCRDVRSVTRPFLRGGGVSESEVPLANPTPRCVARWSPSRRAARAPRPRRRPRRRLVRERSRSSILSASPPPSPPRPLAASGPSMVGSARDTPPRARPRPRPRPPPPTSTRSSARAARTSDAETTTRPSPPSPTPSARTADASSTISRTSPRRAPCPSAYPSASPSPCADD